MKKRELEAALEFERAKNRVLARHLADAYMDIDSLTDGDEDELLPEIDEVILNGPATVVKWTDGTKTVSKCRGGDEFDPLFGVLACTVRKLTSNRGHAVDMAEDTLRGMADAIHSIDDIECYRDGHLFFSDMLSVLLNSEDKLLDKLGPNEPEKPCEQVKDTKLPDGAVVESKLPNSVVVAVVGKTDEIEEQVREKMPDLIRQEIRNLFDAGEL